MHERLETNYLDFVLKQSRTNSAESQSLLCVCGVLGVGKQGRGREKKGGVTFIETNNPYQHQIWFFQDQVKAVSPWSLDSLPLTTHPLPQKPVRGQQNVRLEINTAGTQGIKTYIYTQSQSERKKERKENTYTHTHTRTHKKKKERERDNWVSSPSDIS